MKKVTGPYSKSGSSTQLFDTQNVLYSKLRPYLNKVVCPDDSGVATTELVPLRPDPTRLDRRFLTHYLRSPQFVRWISNEVAGAKMPRVSMNVFWGHQIPLPPLEKQKRIAAILDAAAELRTKRRESLAQLDTLLQSTFLDLFGDPVTNPKEWEEKLLSEVVRPGTIVTYGIVQAGDEFSGGIPYIRTGDIVDGEIVQNGLRHTNPAIASKFERSRVDAGDIVMSIRATVGTTAVVPPSLDGANLTQGTARIAPGPDALLPFLLHYLRSHGAQRWIQRQVKGATFKEITLGRLRELPVLLPPIAIQKKFGEIVAQIEERRLLERNQLEELDHLFASLQSRAFRGEL
ncbi:MAG: restriction endonuclease subunit S [Luteolibacter sp.]|nr:restriction endonuclease subunit S [Luteolibacter sp.]